jgi:hypothetical protein
MVPIEFRQKQGMFCADTPWRFSDFARIGFEAVRASQMDREHAARRSPQAQAHVAKANGPRSAWLAPFTASTGLCCNMRTKWSASMLLASILKHWPLLRQAGCKPAIHLVCSKPNSPALKSKGEGEHFSVGRRLQPAPAEGPGRVVHAKRGGPQ